MEKTNGVKTFDFYIAKIRAEEKRYDELEAKFGDFNPEMEIIVSKEQYNIINQLQVLNELAAKVNEVHAVTTGKLYQPKPRKKSQKQKDNEELQQMRRNAHQRVLNAH
jgi:small-conductance mechanosensitive channel